MRDLRNLIEYYDEVYPILKELEEIGISVNTISDLKVINKIDYQKAIPILCRWLPIIKEVNIKDDIVRTLSLPYSKPALDTLIDEYRSISGTNFNHLKWSIGNALEILIDDNNYKKIMPLLKDRSQGSNREMIALGFGKIKNQESEKMLIELLDDESIQGHVIMALRKMKSSNAKRKLQPFLNHKKAWIRNEAKRALDQLSKSQKI